MPTKFVYNGQTLIKFKDKTAGKNKSPVDGFYETEDEPKKKYFIKKPADQRELFIEGLIGRLFTKLKERGLIEKEYHRSFICADFIQCEDGQYALIQPCENFDELFKLIGTGYKDGSDRDPIYEMFYGTGLYPGLTKLGAYFGLSSVLMLAILVGNYSVHSGNIVVLKDDYETEKGKVKQFAGIDNGAANRDFAHPDNNGDDILIPREYIGTINTAWFTKGYIANYQYIKNLRPSMQKHAEKLREKLEKQFGSTLFADLMTEIFQELPADLLKPEDKETRQSLAKYMHIRGFETATFGKEGNFQAVHTAYVDTLNKRLAKLCHLQEAPHLVADSSATVYQSILFSDPSSPTTVEEQGIPLTAALNMEERILFPTRMESWLEHFKDLSKPIDFTQIEYGLLTQQFTHYVDILAHQGDLYNVWGHDPSSTHNFLVPSDKMSDKAEHGYAFVPQYRESRILHHLYAFQSVEQHGFSRFTSYDKLCGEFRKTEAAKGSAWQKITDALDQAQGLLTMLKQLQLAADKDASLGEEDILFFRETLNKYLSGYLEASKQINELFASHTDLGPINQDSLFFYPIKDSELSEMSGDQLLTICFEELHSIQPELLEFSPLAARIITEDKLWARMLEVYPESTFKNRLDNKDDKKMDALTRLRDNFVECRAKIECFHESLTLLEKERAFAEIEKGLDQLPLHLQARLKQEFEDASSVLLFWQEANEAFQAKLHEYDTSLSTKLKERQNACQLVIDAFNSLPKPLQEAHQEDLKRLEADYERLVDELGRKGRYVQARDVYDEATTLEAKLISFNELLQAFENLSVNKKKKFQSSFDIAKSDYENTYLKLKTNETVKPETSIEEIERVLNLIDTNEKVAVQLRAAAISDRILWQAIATAEKKLLSTEIANDLLILKQFRDNHVEANPKEETYVREIDAFYQESLTIRLSAAPIKEQAMQIINAAETKFSHRDWFIRALADAMMLVGILFAGLGAVFMLARYCSNTHPLFSGAKTNRQTDLQNLMQNSAQLDEKEETCLFHEPPTILVQ